MKTPWRPGIAGSPAPAPDGDPAAGSIHTGGGVIVVACLTAGLLTFVFLLRGAPDPKSVATDFLERVGIVQRSRCGERSPAVSLKTIAVAQADFRANDRDANGIDDFWRADVAGLYGLCPKESDEMIKLIEVSVAGADEGALDAGASAPTPGAVTAQGFYTTRSPKAGYWYRAILHADETLPGPDRFALCGFPDSYGKSGRWTFILDESLRIRKKDLGRGGGVLVHPADPIAEGWIPLN